MERILVSACLLGHPVRWDGRGARFEDGRVARWHEEGRLVALCPEQAGGLGTPRPPAEIEAGVAAVDVIVGRGRVHGPAGEDLTAAFLRGAEEAVALAQARDCRLALLMDGSSSSGSRAVHDGRFAGVRIAGEGMTAALLRRAGIEVFAPARIDDLARRLAELKGRRGGAASGQG